MDPERCDGKPCLAETTVDVATAVGVLGMGKSFAETQEMLGLTYEQVLTALRYASYVTDHLPLRMPPHSSQTQTGQSESGSFR